MFISEARTIYFRQRLKMLPLFSVTRSEGSVSLLLVHFSWPIHPLLRRQGYRSLKLCKLNSYFPGFITHTHPPYLPPTLSPPPFLPSSLPLPPSLSLPLPSPTHLSDSNKMHKITEGFEEFHQRWRQIENTCGFSITMTRGTAACPVYSSSINWSLDGDNLSVTTNMSTTRSLRTWRSSRRSLFKDSQASSSRDQQKQYSTSSSSSSSSMSSLQHSGQSSTQTTGKSNPRQMSLPTEGLTRSSAHHSSSRGMHSTTSAPGMLSSSGWSEVVSDSLVDKERAVRGDGDGSIGRGRIMNGWSGGSEEKQKWWIGSRGAIEPLLAIREEEVRTIGQMATVESEDSPERVVGSSSDSFDEKEYPLSGNRAHETKKRSLKSKLKSTLKGKSS